MGAEIVLNPPNNLPIGVRQAAMIQACDMVLLLGVIL